MAERIGAIFPGQGSQSVGMIRELLEVFPETKEVFAEVNEALHEHFDKLCLEGPEEDLQRTANAQPAILATSYAWYQGLKKRFDFVPAAGAGHSLGEYSALTAAGAISLEDAVKLVRARGLLMQEAVPVGQGKMAALLGLSDIHVIALCEAASRPDSIVTPANFNSPGQTVIAGHTSAVERAEALASSGENPDWKARKVIPLKVSAPFHCPLMAPVASAFEAHVKSVHWKPRAFGIVHNVDAKFREKIDTEELVPLLCQQIEKPVLWTQCQTALSAEGITRFLEMGPGKVLTGLGKRISAEATFQTVDSAADLKKVETWF